MSPLFKKLHPIIKESSEPEPPPVLPVKSKYFKEFQGRVYAYINRGNRQSSEDAVYLHHLSSDELRTYSLMKEEGKSDKEIFDVMFKPGAKQSADNADEVLIPVEDLTKKQLVSLMAKRLSLSPESLNKMTSDDLRTLFKKVHSGSARL